MKYSEKKIKGLNCFTFRVLPQERLEQNGVVMVTSIAVDYHLSLLLHQQGLWQALDGPLPYQGLENDVNIQ